MTTAIDERRLKRAMTQPIILLSIHENEFIVKGAANKTYKLKGDVQDEKSFTCTCGDFKFRHQICKHILFITKKPGVFNKFNSKSNSNDVKVDDNDDCGICLESLSSDPEFHVCQNCQQPVHMRCFLCWAQAAINNTITCIYCRASL